MDRIYHEDIAKIDLANNGSIHRTFLNRTIGKDDDFANRFGVELYYNGEALNLGSSSCIGLFMAPDGQNILISDDDHTYTGGNLAYVQLPQACYSAEGNFTLAIKIIESPVTNTVRIIDGVVCNTGADDPVAPVDSVPTYQEILAVYDQMLAAKAGSVRFDIAQSLTEAEQAQAQDNTGVTVSKKEVSSVMSTIQDEEVLSLFKWEQGAYRDIDDYSGMVLIDSSTRIRCNLSFDTPEDIRITFVPNNGYSYALAVFDVNNVCIHTFSLRRDFERSYAGVKTLRLMMAKTNDSAITPADQPASGINVVRCKKRSNMGVILDSLIDPANMTYKSAWVTGADSSTDYSSPNPNYYTYRIRTTIVFSSPTNICVNNAGNKYNIGYIAFDENGDLIADIIDLDRIFENRFIKDVKTLKLNVKNRNDSSSSHVNIAPDEIFGSGISVVNIASSGESTEPINLKLMTYNVGRFNYGGAGGVKHLLPEIYDEKVANYRQFFAEERCEILGLQECNKWLDVDSGDGTKNTDTVLFSWLYPYVQNVSGGACIKSKYPLLNSAYAQFTASDRYYSYGTIHVNGKYIFIMSVHLSPNADQETTRRAEAEELIEILKGHEYFICFGDFNAVDPTLYDLFKNEGFKVMNGGDYLPMVWTYSHNRPYDYEHPDAPTGSTEVLDNIVVSNNIICNYFEREFVFDDLSSDHIPVIGWFTIP